MASRRLLVLGVLASVVLLQHVSHAQFDANLTLQSSFGHLRKRSRSLLRCWSEERDPAHIVFERPGGLPRASQRLLQDSEAHILILPGSAGLSRTGLFSCRVDAGGIPTAVATLKLPPTAAAQVEPLQAYVVAHVGETVHLSVTKRMHLAEPLVWRLEGMDLPEFAGSETVTLVNVEQADAGVYECHYRGQRDARLHAWIRLVVAGCPRGKFGPTCQEECPPCRNGGMCHDTYGVCVCPAGFAGPNCDTPCGPNRVGSQCDRVCSPVSSPDSERRGCGLHVFCKPDPMSCSCAPGFKGPQCNQECEAGHYGADCLQRCHCAVEGDCDSITGECPKGCSAGWTGESCHIQGDSPTTSTKSVPTQKPSCPPGWFGKACSHRCHCADGEACDPSSGECPGSCQPGYSRPTCAECLSGMFGDNCSLTCHCWNGDQNCMPDGRCHDGCAAGWTGERCQQACPTNTFGPDCAYECHCAEDSSACDPVSGTCSACEPGYQGLSCQEKCKAGKYGENCSESCSCLHSETCHHINGSCQCTGHHRGHSCDEMVPEVLPSEEVEVDQGHPGSLECLVEANPAPVVELSNQETRQNLTKVTVKDEGGGTYRASAPLPRTMEPGSYKFHCTARNEHGFDVGTLHVTVLGPPELTTAPQVKLSADSAVVSWEPSNSPAKKHGGRGNQIEYQLHVRAKASGGNWTTVGPWQTAVRQNASPLEPDTEYEFAVQLRRGKLTAWGPPVSVRTPCRADSPEAVPKNVVAKALSDRRISIRWEKPDPKLLGCKLVGFEVHLSARNAPSSVQSLDADTVHTVVDDLDADSSYDVAVYAVTSVGRSMYNASATAKTARAVPGPVEHLSVVRSNVTAATITWDAPAGIRHPHHLEYRVAIVARDLGGCGLKGSEQVSLTQATQFQVDGLVPHSWYEARVSASSGHGYGKRREVSFLTATARPSKPPGKVRVVWASSRSLHLSWEAPSCLDARGPILYYHVLYYTDLKAEDDQWANTTDTNLTLQGLMPFQKHTMRVRAVNSAGAGPLSPRVTVSTTEDVPGELEWLAVADVNETTVRLSWHPPEEPNGVLTGYEVMVTAQVDNDTEDNSSLLLATAVGPDVRELLLSQLLNGRSYTATVRATTSVGRGPALAVHFATLSLVGASVQEDIYWSLHSMIPWVVAPFGVAIFLLLVNAALVIIVSRRKHRSLEVSNVPFTSSTASTAECDEFELSKHPAPGDSASEDGFLVDWSPPRSFQSTYI
ncbi:tenascin [Dermacentor silvarum]|uniref:tenascin n=1 Tax=Dermacentor silvarum TaxID=543639 RepID=UPI001898F630|nr:tenascin [Dermacentor silvarum]